MELSQRWKGVGGKIQKEEGDFTINKKNKKKQIQLTDYVSIYSVQRTTGRSK